tara:strand:+ start:692 stop:1468 length:777 start_codon:yes stop_codon:yes gene_type:complete
MRSTAPLRSSLLNATQRFVYFITPLLGVPLRPSTLLNSAIFLLSTHRFSSPRPSTPLNDLFFISATQLCESHLITVLRPAPQLNDLFFISATQLCESHLITVLRPAPQLNDLFVTTPLFAAMCIAARRNDTQLNDLFVTTRRIDTRLSAPQLYSAICLSSTPLCATKRSDTLRRAMLFNSTICLSQRSASPLGYPPRTAPRLGSTPLNDLFIILAPPLNSTIRGELLLNSTQRFVYYPRLSALLDNARRNAAPLNVTN